MTETGGRGLVLLHLVTVDLELKAQWTSKHKRSRVWCVINWCMGKIQQSEAFPFSVFVIHLSHWRSQRSSSGMTSTLHRVMARIFTQILDDSTWSYISSLSFSCGYMGRKKTNFRKFTFKINLMLPLFSWFFSLEETLLLRELLFL